jgi:phosphatidylserine/phosphatidylglycerophosphate/cardiolipin synthase-like enzyme
MSQLQEWQSMGLPSSVRSIQDVIAYLSQNNHLKPDDTAFLYSLVDKEESALAAQYIDYALHRPRGQNNSLECVSSEQLVADFVQRSIGILISPFLMAGIAQTSHLTEEARLCHAVEKALELSIDGNNTPHSQLLSDMLDSLRKSPTPLLFLSRFLSGIRQIKYWQNTIETMHRTKGADLFAFYQAFSEATPHLLGSPFTLRQRAILSSQLQGPLKAASWGEALRIPTDWRGPMSVHVCRDSVEGIQQKFQLLQKAKNSVVLSGSYFGGAPLSEALSIIREKLRTNPKFNAYILGSEYMLKPENHAEFQGLKNAYPDRFHLVLNHEVNPFTNPYTGRFFLMCNHVKLLVIDEGTDFLIGGSGIEERWANHDGIKDIDPGNLSTGEPLAFRDADYVFHSESPNGLGKLLHHKLLELCAHCCYMKNEDLAKRYFDPRFYPISKTNEAVATLPPTGPQTQAHIEFFATNPEEAVSNGFEQRLIQLIENAQKRIVIDHMYFHPTEALLQSLIRASNRDVSILLITNQDQPNTPGTHKLFVPRSRYMWKQLFEGKRKTNVCIFEYLVPYTTLHKKVMLIDNCVATGSANCGLLSMEGLNHEYNVIVHSETVAGQTMDLIEADIDQSRLVPDEEAMTISLAERRSGIATAPLQYFF